MLMVFELLFLSYGKRLVRTNHFPKDFSVKSSHFPKDF